MLFKFTVKVDKGATVKQVEALNAKLADNVKLNKFVGMGFARTLQRHFNGLDSRPNKRGWRPLGFWRKISAATSFVSADSNKAVVGVSGVQGKMLAAKIFGTRITPKSGKKFLAIPAIESRYGISPSALDEELQFRKTRKGGLLGTIRSDGTFLVNYFLVRSANLPCDPQALPKFETVENDAKKSISTYLNRK